VIGCEVHVRRAPSRRARDHRRRLRQDLTVRGVPDPATAPTIACILLFGLPRAGDKYVSRAAIGSNGPPAPHPASAVGSYTCSARGTLRTAVRAQAARPSDALPRRAAGAEPLAVRRSPGGTAPAPLLEELGQGAESSPLARLPAAASSRSRCGCSLSRLVGQACRGGVCWRA
jgi:hypothetical protein